VQEAHFVAGSGNAHGLRSVGRSSFIDEPIERKTKKLNNGTWLLSRVMFAEREHGIENVRLEDDGICVNGRNSLPQRDCPDPYPFPVFTRLATQCQIDGNKFTELLH
jgi:hypothetical protein